MPEVLIVDDSPAISSLLADRVNALPDMRAVTCGSLADCKELLGSGKTDFFIALLDLTLPDAPDGEVVDYVLGHKIPCIVLTGEYSPEIRERIWSKNVVDYVYKQSLADILYAVGVVRRVARNQNRDILIVDDSLLYRKFTDEILRSQLLNPIQAESAEAALDIMKTNKDISMVLVDYNLPGMNGFDLTVKLRKISQKDNMAIIAISEFNTKEVASRFLRLGANDSLAKPYSREEFLCRLNLHLDNLEMIKAFRESAETDYLTGLYNRRHFINLCEEKLKQLEAGNIKRLTVAILDLDRFKQINDTFGHLTGDEVLISVGKGLKNLESDQLFAARFGGEEFSLLFIDTDDETIRSSLNSLAAHLEADIDLMYDGSEKRLSFSGGVSSCKAESLNEWIRRADELLYAAKRDGRDRIYFESA